METLEKTNSDSNQNQDLERKQKINLKKKLSSIKFSKRVVIIIIASALLMGVAVAFFAYKSMTTYKFREPAVYSAIGIDYQIPSGSTAEVDDEGRTIVHPKGESEMPVDEAGIFFTESNRMLTIKPMSYYRANQTDIFEAKQVAPLTEITCEYDMTTFQKDGKSFEEEGDFLYDGNNTYITLRRTKLVIGDELIAELSPLSYVICCYKNWVAYRDFKDGKYNYIVLNENPDAEYREVKLYYESDDVTVVCDRDRARSPYDDFMLTTAITMLENVLK